MTPEQWKEVERLYSSSIEMPPHQRAQFLAESGTDEAIRREVESLLAHREKQPSFIERPGLDVAADMINRNPVVHLVGHTIGPYEVRAFIGAGGMGTVYRAHDTRLSRDVAIKILPAAFSDDPERVRRSEREAKLLASLNHPNIAAIYDLEESDGIQCLVLELVEGQTLADRLKRGGIPLAECLDLTRQIAEALEAAHEQGIVHRDLKPGNIMITTAGNAKVLDFGIAKMLEPQTQENTPTNIDSASAGVVLGTPSYMSPEQARGKPIDKRTDIWAFGCVLYELLTGRRAFQGETVTDTLAAVVERDPDWQAVPENTPEKMKDLLRRCLQKDVRQRLRDIGDARIQLEAAREPVAARLLPGASKRSFWRWALPMIAASLALGSLFAWVTARTHTVAPGVTRLTMGIQPADQLGTLARSWARPSRTLMAFSPDGQTIVFSAMRENAIQLFSRRLDQSIAAPIPGTSGGVGPFFSPDGKWVAFWADRKIKKVPIDGGPTLTICDVPGGGQIFGATWAENDTIFFSSPLTAPRIFKAPSAGGKPEEAITPNVADGEQFILPQALPGAKGAKALLLTARKSFDSDTARVVLHSLETGENRPLIEGAADARYVRTGHLVYMKSGTLMAVSFDLGKLQVTGEPVALVENVMQAAGMQASGFETTSGQFAVAASGTLVYLTGGIGPPRETSLVLLNRKGEVQEGRLPAPVPSASVHAPRLSPDQGKVAVTRGAKGHSDVWVYDLLGTGFHRVTFTDTDAYAAVWSPDGKRLVYGSWLPGGHSNLYVVNADGNSPPERLTIDSEFQQFASSWTPVGNLIAFMQEDLPNTSEIWTIGMDDGKKNLFLKNPAPGIRLQYPEFSPDGHWMAYVSTESGGNEVYVRAYPGGGESHKISVSRGNSPIWTSSGRELLYRAAAGDVERFFSVAITSLSPFQSAPPQKLFEAPRNQYTNSIGVRSWDATPDGQRLLLERFEESRDKPATEFQITLNWTEELKRRVPAK